MRAHVDVAEQRAAWRRSIEIVGDERVERRCIAAGLLARNASENQRVTWKSTSAAMPFSRAASARSLNFCRRVRAVPRRGVDQPERGGACGIESGKRQRDAAAHRAAARPPPFSSRRGRAAPRDRARKFRRVGDGPAVGSAVAAAVVGEHIRVASSWPATPSHMLRSSASEWIRTSRGAFGCFEERSVYARTEPSDRASELVTIVGCVMRRGV